MSRAAALFIALLLTLPSPLARAGDDEAPGEDSYDHPLRVRPGLELALTAGLAVPYAILFAGTPFDGKVELPPPSSQPQVGSMDAVALGHFLPDVARVSDVLLYSSIAAPLALHALESGLSGERFGPRFGTDALILAETLVVNGLLTDLFKNAVSRYRPFAYLAPADVSGEAHDKLVEAQEDPDVQRSWPSGHSSTTFAMAAAGSTLLALKQRASGGPVAPVIVAYGATFAAAGTTAVLRVVAGKHYPSDVISGAALGLAVGIAVPLLHQRLADLPRLPQAPPVAVAPIASEDFKGLVLVGTLP